RRHAASALLVHRLADQLLQLFSRHLHDSHGSVRNPHPRLPFRLAAGLRRPARDLQCHRRIGGTTLRVGSAGARHVCVPHRRRASRQGPAYSTTPPTTVAAMGTSGSSSTATSSTSRSNTVRSAS